MLERVSLEPNALRDAAEELKGDRDIVMTAVSHFGHALRFATEELKGDREIVMTAVSENSFALQYVTKELKCDREIVRAAVSQHGRALQFVAEELKGDREIVMTAVSKAGWALQFATKEMQGDHEIVMKAVSENGCALEFATEELRGDSEIVMQAVSVHGDALEYATKSLREDEEMLQHALERSRNCGEVVGLKVALLSGRCCSEVFWTRALASTLEEREEVLRRCAASLDLDPDYVGNSVAFLVVEKLWPSPEQEASTLRQWAKNWPNTKISNERPSLVNVSPFLAGILMFCRWPSLAPKRSYLCKRPPFANRVAADMR